MLRCASSPHSLTAQTHGGTDKDLLLLSAREYGIWHVIMRWMSGRVDELVVVVLVEGIIAILGERQAGLGVWSSMCFCG